MWFVWGAHLAFCSWPGVASSGWWWWGIRRLAFTGQVLTLLRWLWQRRWFGFAGLFRQRLWVRDVYVIYGLAIVHLYSQSLQPLLENNLVQTTEKKLDQGIRPFGGTKYYLICGGEIFWCFKKCFVSLVPARAFLSQSLFRSNYTSLVSIASGKECYKRNL